MKLQFVYYVLGGAVVLPAVVWTVISVVTLADFIAAKFGKATAFVFGLALVGAFFGALIGGVAHSFPVYP